MVIKPLKRAVEKKESVTQYPIHWIVGLVTEKEWKDMEEEEEKKVPTQIVIHVRVLPSYNWSEGTYGDCAAGRQQVPVPQDAEDQGETLLWRRHSQPCRRQLHRPGTLSVSSSSVARDLMGAENESDLRVHGRERQAHVGRNDADRRRWCGSLFVSSLSFSLFLSLPRNLSLYVAAQAQH